MFLARMLLCSGALLAAAASAQEGGDLQAQILYAYQVEDIHALNNVIQDLRAKMARNSDEVALRYHLAHADYRLGLLMGARRSPEAAAAFSECIDALKPTLEEDVKSAESLALQSACYFELADHKRLQGALLRSRASDRLGSAMRLSPRNPRAVYLSAIEGLSQSRPDSAQRLQALAQLQLAVQLFDAASATASETVGWGHAEAYLALARELLARGDRAGARNLIEKSLLAAPEYKAAQRQLALLQ